MKQRREAITLENEGERLFGILHHPAEENPPLVLILHGFASHKIGTGGSYLKLAEAICKAGIAVFRFDFRGFGDSEGEKATCNLEGFVSDVLVAAKALRSRGFSRLGLFGSSFGGTVGLLAAAKADLFKSIVLWAPVASGKLWIQDFMVANSSKGASAEEMQISYKGVVINPKFREEFMQMRADSALAKLGTIPLLHFQGDLDETISIHHQQAFQEARQSSKAKTQFELLKNVKHSLGGSEKLENIIEQTTTWFKNTL